METEEISQQIAPAAPQAGVLKTTVACVVGALVPGLGHALLNKWDRALVFFGSICVMFVFGLQLRARVFSPDFTDLFSILKFAAEAGSGLLYWVSWISGLGPGDPAAYAYDFGNIFLYVAGLLNMLVVVDVFDIAMGRKQ